MNEFLSSLKQFLESDNELCWLVHPGVYLDDDWDDFYFEFDSCPADLLATRLRRFEDDQSWSHWKSIQKATGSVDESELLAASVPVVRISRAAASAVLEGVAEGWTGHVEVLVPTLVQRANLLIEDIGGGGPFCPPDRKARWYDARTIRERSMPEFVPRKLHYPVDIPDAPLANIRVKQLPRSLPPRILFTSPVGKENAHLIDQIANCFSSSQVDLLFIAYDGVEYEWPKNSSVVRDTGKKWQLAMRHLQPEHVSDYDYIFNWDDDIRPNAFDPARFTRIMEINSLDMAQPAILSPFGLSHGITAPRTTPPPWFFDKDGARYKIAGRLTNFVEIMAPAFSRNGWARFFEYLSEDNHSGWGYDYAPIGAKGIVDTMPVTHTRAVQSMTAHSNAERDSFLKSQGLFNFATANYGWLFEEAEPS